MKVKATRLGYLGHRRRKVGEVFHIDSKLFSEHWMEKLDDSKPAASSKPKKSKSVEVTDDDVI